MEEIKNDSHFSEVIKKPNLTVVHFSADFVEQCKHVDDVLQELSKEVAISTKAKFFNCPAEKFSKPSLIADVKAVPTVVIFRANKIIDRVEGADAAKITAKIKQHIDTSNLPPTLAPPPPPELSKAMEKRLRDLVASNKIMLFMKGTPDAPKCGFSRQMIEILTNVGCQYGTFDILSDNEVRESLKIFSDWPTYPQLYKESEFVGGLDIVKSLAASGSLQGVLTEE